MGMNEVPGRMMVLRWGTLVVALTLLNVSLTFRNIWPTLSVQLSSELSVELAVCVLWLVFSWRWRRVSFLATRGWLAVVWVVLVIGRYTEVTARALYGRDVNLYWDLRHLPDVGAMFAIVVQPWLVMALLAAMVFVTVLLYVTARWALNCVGDAINDRRTRYALCFLASGVLLLGVGKTVGARLPEMIRFAEPVVPAYAREVRELVYEISGAGVRALGPPPVIRSDLARVHGADVFLVFLESYGAVSWDNPELAMSLAQSRARFEDDINETGRTVVSAFVESTTFGGESWLAHISLLSGTEVRDQGTNVRLMAQERDTLVKVFGRQGYRTVALMPGLLRGWPQGAFYGFDDVYDLSQIAYQGPSFGWWDVNDQFALARVDAIEIEPQPRQPVFVFFPTITTHAPFVPTPPYQSDWARILTDTPYDAVDLDHAWSDYPDWLNLGPGYVKGLTYAHATVGGYLRLRADRDFVLILVGDHQPSAFLSGEGASWNVPVHVIANRRGVLERLRQHGFTVGLAPQHPTVARMDTLLPLLLDAFGNGYAAASQ